MSCAGVDRATRPGLREVEGFRGDERGGGETQSSRTNRAQALPFTQRSCTHAAPHHLCHQKRGLTWGRSGGPGRRGREGRKGDFVGKRVARSGHPLRTRKLGLVHAPRRRYVYTGIDVSMCLIIISNYEMEEVIDGGERKR